jgi:hypothetical protein
LAPLGRPLGIEERGAALGANCGARVSLEQRFFEQSAQSSEVTDLCQKISLSLYAWLEASVTERAGADGCSVEVEWQTTLEELGSGTDTPAFAGRTRGDAESVRAAIMSGHLRECFFQLNKFLQYRFFYDVVSSPEAVFEGILGRIKWAQSETWIRDLRMQLRPRGANPGDPLQLDGYLLFRSGMTKKGTPLACIRAPGSPPIDRKLEPTNVEDLDEQYVAALCRKIGITCDAESRVSELKKLGYLKTQEGEGHPYAWSRVPKEDLYLPLTSREDEFSNLIDERWVPYIRGDYANCLVEDHPWVQEARRLELPLRSGPSGTAHRFLSALVGFGHPPRASRLAIAAFLGPIHAHSCHEILFGTTGIAGCTYDPNQYRADFGSVDEFREELFGDD